MDNGAVGASALDVEVEDDVLRLADPRHRARGVVQLRVQIEALKWRVRTKHGGSESVWEAYPVVMVLPPEVMKVSVNNGNRGCTLDAYFLPLAVPSRLRLA